ncbi:helix-turn-helix domain-containing protein [Aeromonas allosaccharophila]
MAKGNEVLALVAKGLPRSEIAKRTGISISSVQRILRSQSN